jgi:pyrroline-5-carboxylate reductase
VLRVRAPGEAMFVEDEGHLDMATAISGTGPAHEFLLSKALHYLEKADFRTAISRAVLAAHERSLELAKEKSTHMPESQADEAADFCCMMCDLPFGM